MFWRNNEKMERRKMIKKIFVKTLTIKYLIFFTILNILYANDKDFRPQKNIFNKINDYYLKDSYNYYGTKKKVLLVDISDINKLIIGDKDLEEIFEIDDIPIKIVNEYFFSKNNVYYCGEKIKDVDLNSFEILSYGYSKDKNNIYYEENTFLNGSIKNLEIYNRYFFRNNGYLYLRRIFFNDTFIENLKKIKINSNIKLIKIDNYFFSFDENTILYEDFAGVHFINVENSKKFKKIKYYYYTDEKNIYYMYKKIPEVDLDSFEIINKYYSKDKNNIYFKNFKVDKYIDLTKNGND